MTQTNNHHYGYYPKSIDFLGMAAIDFCYSSWLMATIQRNVEAWRDWYKSHSTLKVVLPNVKLRPRKRKFKHKV